MRTIRRRLFIGLLLSILGGSAVALTDSPAPDVIPPTDPPPVPVAPPKPDLAPKPDPSVALEWAGPPSVRVNRPAEYTLTVRNTSSQPVQKVVVQLRTPADVTVGAVSPEPRRVEGIRLWELGTLQPKESRPLSMTLTSANRGELGCQAWVTFTGTTSMKVAVQEPKIEVAIAAPKSVAVGDPIPLTYTVKNVGDCDADSIQLVLKPEDAEAVTSPMVETLATAKSREFQTVARATRAGDLHYSVVATGADGLKTTATATVHVLAPKLELRVAGTTDRLVGRTAEYTLTVANTGPLTVDDVRLTGKLPAGFRDVKPDADGQLIDGHSAAWSLGTLKPGESRQLALSATAATVGEFVPTFAVAGSRGAQAGADIRTVVEGISALRMELVDLVDPVEKNGETTYEIRVTNTGSKADENVMLSCPLPAELELISAIGPVTHTAQELNRITVLRFAPIRDLAPQTEAVFRVKVKAIRSGDVRFKAQLQSRYLTTSVVKEESTRIYGD